MAELELEIISKTGSLFSDKAHLVVVPAIGGEIGFMYDHELVITELKEGKVQVFDESEKLLKEFDVKSGYAHMQDDHKLIVLVD